MTPARDLDPARTALPPNDQRPIVGWFGIGILLWLGALGALHLLSDLSSQPLEMLGLLAVAFSGLVLLSRSAGRRLESRRWLLGLAIFARVVVVPLAPDLSNDVWRYLWDGRVAAAGFDPYRTAPDDPELAELRGRDAGALWDRVHHRSIPTVYPPLALTMQSVCARLPGGLWWWKGLLTVVDLLACWLLLRLADAKGLSRSRVSWYALNPLVLLEVSAMGHVDVLGVTAVLLAVVALSGERRRWFWSAVAAAAGCLTKLVPLVAWPLWARSSGRTWSYVVVATAVAGLALWPVLAPGIPPGLVTYAVSWEFNGPLYEPLWRILEWGGITDLGHSLLDSTKRVTGWHSGLNRLYSWVYPRFVAKLLLAGLAGAVWIRSFRRRELVTGTGELFGGLLLCVATLYPWYLLWVLPWAALSGHRAWLWASGAVLLSYWPQFGAVELWPWVYLLIWGPCAVIWWVDRRGGERAWTLR